MRVFSCVKIFIFVGLVYIIGEGNIVIIVFLGFSIFFFIIVWCCVICIGKGMLFCLVYFFKGCSNNIGFLNFLLINFCWVFWGEGKWNKNFDFKELNGMVISFVYLMKIFYCYFFICSNCVDRVEESLDFL